MFEYIPLKNPPCKTTMPPDVAWCFIAAPPQFARIAGDMPIAPYEYGIVMFERLLTRDECMRFALRPL